MHVCFALYQLFGGRWVNFTVYLLCFNSNVPVLCYAINFPLYLNKNKFSMLGKLPPLRTSFHDIIEADIKASIRGK